MQSSGYPSNTEVVCSNVVLNNEGLLLVREAKSSTLGRWSLPAGRLETGESLRDGAAREALEETGLIVDVDQLLGIYHCASSLEGGSAVNFVFRSRVVGGEIRTTAQHPGVEFVSRAVVDSLLREHRIRGQHVAHALAAADAGSELPFGLIVEVPSSPRPSVNP